MNNKAERIINALYEHYYNNATDDAKQMISDAKDEFMYCIYDLIAKDVNFGEKYLCAPGASRHHHNHKYGLLEHSFELCMELACITVARKHELTAKEIGRIAFAHDLCKVDTYSLNSDKTVFCNGALYQRHAISSIEIAEKYEMNLSAKEKACIYIHMSKWAGGEDYTAVAADMDIIKAVFGYTRDIADVQDADMAACKQYDCTLAIVNEED